MVSTNSRCGNGGMVLSEEESEHLKKEIYDVAMGVPPDDGSLLPLASG
jgi:hypothetical protein